MLELLHSCALTNLSLRTDILRCLMAALKESHRYIKLNTICQISIFVKNINQGFHCCNAL